MKTKQRRTRPKKPAIPAAPPDMPNDALAVWNYYAPRLTRPNGKLHPGDGSRLEVLCRELARYRRCENLIASTGGELVVVGGVPRLNPALTQSAKSRAVVVNLLNDFDLALASGGKDDDLIDNVLDELE